MKQTIICSSAQSIEGKILIEEIRLRKKGLFQRIFFRVVGEQVTNDAIGKYIGQYNIT